MKRRPFSMTICNTDGNPLGPDVEAREVWALRTRREVKSRGLLGVHRQIGEVTWHPWPRKAAR